MSRTNRKTKNDKVYNETQYKKHKTFKCKCNYCSIPRKKLLSRRISIKEIKKEIKEYEYRFDD